MGSRKVSSVVITDHELIGTHFHGVDLKYRLCTNVIVVNAKVNGMDSFRFHILRNSIRLQRIESWMAQRTCLHIVFMSATYSQVEMIN